MGNWIKKLCSLGIVVNLLKEIWGNLVIILFGGFVLWHFLMVLKYGAVQVQEQNPVVLYFEIGAVSLLILLGIERLIHDLRGKK